MLQTYLHRVFRGTEALNKTTILRLVEPCPGGKLLDCGCGDGSFTMEVARRVGATEVHGIEAVEERIRAAEERGILVARTDLNERFPYEDASFDVVHSNQLIEHLHATDGFLRELRRVVKPAGRVILSTNNLASWHNVFSLVLGYQPMSLHVSAEVILGNPFDPLRHQRHPEGEDSHLRIFSVRGLEELCIHHGFRVLDLRTAGYYPFPPSVASLLTRLDRRHGAFLIAKLVPAAPADAP